MATELISFRLSNSELDWLKSHCESGESLNLTAKRLLLSLLKGVDSVDSSVNSVDTTDNSPKLDELESRLDERFTEIEARLKKAESLSAELETLRQLTNGSVDSVDNSVDRCRYLEQWLTNTLPKLKRSPGYKPNSASKLIASIERLV